MESKLTEEQGKKIKDLKEEIQSLQKEINEKEVEVERVIVESKANFADSYVEFYDGEDYVFMKVERQIVRAGGAKIYLQGPAIRLDDDPLSESYNDYDGISMGSYDENDGFSFGLKVLEDCTVEWIRKISKEDMIFVLDYYINTVKKNLV
jgi:hypothetical protein